MDCIKVGQLIRKMRLKRNLTQKQLADMMNLSDKTISKWERGLGCPDISLLTELSGILRINIEKLLNGDAPCEEENGGSMKNIKFYVCPECSSISFSSGNAQISCCCGKLNPLELHKADEAHKLDVEQVENDWYITSNHPMKKDDYILFTAFATGDKIELIKLYPEWNFSVRIQRQGHGMFFWYSEKEGLLYQLL